MSQLPQTSLSHLSLDNVLNVPARDEPIGFVLRLAKALHTYGVPAYELEHTINACAATLGFGVQCLSQPTSIIMTFMQGEEKNVQTFVIRVAPGEINLEKLTLVSQVAQQVMQKQISAKEGASTLKTINQASSAYPVWLTLICFGVISASLARLFNGGWYEIANAFMAGFVVGGLTFLSQKNRLLTHLLPTIAALLVTVVAHWGASIFAGTSVYISIVSGMIILLPGLTLTIAMAELATQNLVSGTARLFGAGAVFMQMAFGSVLGYQLMGNWVNLTQVTIMPLPSYTLWLAAMTGTTALVVLFQARLKDVGWMLLGGLTAFATVQLASQFFNNAMVAFLGAIATGAVANIVSRWKAIPGALMLTPGFILLVPGSVGFKGLTAIVQHDVLTGLEMAFHMTLVGISLVAGLLISSLVTLPKQIQENDPQSDY